MTALQTKGVTIFARVDNAAGAASVNMVLRLTTLIIFGNPAAGTPLMQVAQTAGIDLPLKALVWQDADGSVQLSYNGPGWIAVRHALGGKASRAVAAISHVLETFARHATGSE